MSENLKAAVVNLEQQFSIADAFVSASVSFQRVTSFVKLDGNFCPDFQSVE